MMNRRKYVLVSILFIMSLPVLSQRLITGRVLDINSKESVGQVEVSVFKGTSTTTTRANGYFQLTIDEGDSLLVMHPDYKIGLFAVPSVDVFIVYVEKFNDYPTYLAGQAKLYRYLKDNLRFAPRTRSKRNEGVLLVQLVIDTNGKIEDCVLLNSFHKKYEQNALEVFKGIPGSWSAPKYRKSLIFPLIYQYANSINQVEFPDIKVPKGKVMERIMIFAEDF
jgi:hypothetical protein